MKLLVAVKRVPDPYRRVRLTPEGRIDPDNIAWVLNPFDEVALEWAARLREEGIFEKIETVAVGVGPAAWEDPLRTALARGADRAVLVVDDGPTDASVVSHLLAHVVRREMPDLILMGRQAPGDDQGQTGPMLAAKLGWPQATFASQIELSSDGVVVRVVREVDAGRETLELTLPAVVTVDWRLCEPRTIALPAILKARAKPLDRVPVAEFGSRPPALVTVVKHETPPPRPAGRTVDSVDALIAALRTEARII